MFWHQIFSPLLISERLSVFNNDVSYECEQWLVGLIWKGPHEASVALVRWCVPAEMGHAILPVVLYIVPVLNMELVSLPSLHPDAFHQLLWFHRLLLQSAISEDFDRSTLAAHGFAPAEVLHGVRPPLIIVRGFSSGVLKLDRVRRQSW